MSAIDAALLSQLERLAGLDAGDAEARAQLCLDLSQILAHAERLVEVGVEGAPAEAESVPQLRLDVPADGLARELALACAPSSDGEHFVVPRILP